MYQQWNNCHKRTTGRQFSVFLHRLLPAYRVLIKGPVRSANTSHQCFFLGIIKSKRTNEHQVYMYVKILCSMKILRVLILADFADWPRSTKISSRRIKIRQNKTPQKLTPFSKIKTMFLVDLCHLELLGRYALDLNKNIYMIFHWKKKPAELGYIR